MPVEPEMLHADQAGRESIEERKLRLDRERFDHERQRQTREDKSVLKRGTALVTIGAGLLAATISVSQFLLQRDKASLDRVLEKEKSDRDWKLQAVRMVMDNDKKLFSAEEKERAAAIAIIKTALPVDLYNNILGLAATQSSTTEAKNQFRSAQDLSLSVGKKVGVDAAAAASLPVSAEAQTPPAAAVRFNVKAMQLPTKGYRFTIGLNEGDQTAAQVRRVDYVVDHPSFTKKDYSSSDPNSNFSMSYVGWGAVDEVVATVVFKNDATHKITINMIRELGW